MDPKPLDKFGTVACYQLGPKFTPLEALDVLPFSGRKIQEWGEEGQQLPGHHFFRSDKPGPTGRVGIGGPPILESRGTEGHPEHEVHVGLYPILGSKPAAITEEEFPPRVFLRSPLNPVFLSACDLFQRPLEMPSLFEHPITVDRPNVVEIEIHGQPGDATEKEIERCPALQSQPVSQERVPGYLIQESPEP